MTNKLIKKEVIDVADLVEAVSKVIVTINYKIDQQNESVNRKLAAIMERLDAGGSATETEGLQ